MKLGICTTDFRRQSVETLFDFIKSYDFSQVQLNFASVTEEDLPEKIDSKLINEICNAAGKRQIEIVAINGTFNMVSPDVSKRKKGIGRFTSMAEACHKLNCRILTLCTGTRNPDSMWKWHPDNSSPQVWEELLETTRSLVEIAEKYHIYLGVETEASNVVSSPELARKLLDEIHSPYLKIIMDCANLFPGNTAIPSNVRSVIKNAFDYLGNDIILAHGKDILASTGIMFTSAGKGIIDFDYFLELLKKHNYKGDMFLHGIKNESDLRFSIDFMREKIIRLYK
jgi:sugar phosphate isomerase/epimerase